MSSVRNAIAAFEAHNDTVRKATPPASPARGGTEGDDGGDDFELSTPLTYLEGGMDHAPFDIPFEASARGMGSGSVASDHSATDRASLSRRNRLMQEQSSPQSVEFSKPTVSLLERRKARKQRKEHLLNKRSANWKSSSRRSGSLSSGERESRHTPPSDPLPRSQPRQQPPDPLISNRRFVHTVSAESDGPDESLLDIVSPANSAKQRRMRSMDDDDTQYNSVLTVDHTDDDATLTSVRQIMTSPQPSHLESLSRQEKQQASRHRYQQQQQSVMRTASSSSVETDTRQLLYNQAAVSSRSSMPQREADDDTLDYADILDDENSVEYDARKKEKERRKNKTGFLEGPENTSTMLNKEDMEHYRRSLDTPVAKTAVGVIVAATVGSILLGPVGFLVGAAAVGIGVGVMQIPDEQQANMRDRAKQTLSRAHESALNASDSLSSSCAIACHNQGVTDQLPNEMKQCFTHEEVNHQASQDQDSLNQSFMERQRSDKVTNISLGGGSGLPSFISPADGTSAPSSSGGPSRNRRVACLRKVRITPVDQIHGLAPHLQPRAWLEVLASANTAPDEKSEAMEEVLIVSKDKRHARILLEEGILDSLLFMLNRYFDKKQRGIAIDKRELVRSKLAANCCLTLGKAHCAAVHTEGDLLLMSMYERGTVPEERQLAQMLYEVPHHILSMEPDVFVIQQSSMSVSEALAMKIKELATGVR